MFYCLSISFPVQRQYDVLIRPPIVHLDLEPCVAPASSSVTVSPLTVITPPRGWEANWSVTSKSKVLSFPFLSITLQVEVRRCPSLPGVMISGGIRHSERRELHFHAVFLQLALEKHRRYLRTRTAVLQIHRLRHPRERPPGQGYVLKPLGKLVAVKYV